MDPFNPDTWQHQWAVFMTAPWLLLPLMALAATTGWVVGRALNKGETKGLRAQNDALKSQYEAAESHRKWAEERAADATRAALLAQTRAASLEQKLRDGTSPMALAETATGTVSAITQAVTANAELTEVLRRPLDPASAQAFIRWLHGRDFRPPAKSK